MKYNQIFKDQQIQNYHPLHQRIKMLPHNTHNLNRFQYLFQINAFDQVHLVETVLLLKIVPPLETVLLLKIVPLLETVLLVNTDHMSKIVHPFKTVHSCPTTHLHTPFPVLVILNAKQT
jgi:hypothetical protein